MDLAYNIASPTNAERHAEIIAAWQLAQTSPHTLKAYTRNLIDFCSWLDSHNLDLLTVRRVHIDGYRHTLNLAPTTVARTLAAISSFYRYGLSADMGVLTNPVQFIVRPKIDPDHSSTQGLTLHQARELLVVAKTAGGRSNALVKTLLYTGVRVSELLTATTASYGHDSGHRTLTIQRKGGKVGKVVVPAPAAEALNQYLGTDGKSVVFSQGLIQTQPLFTTRTGRPWDKSDVFRTIQRLARKAGVDGRISPHSLRHTFATIALDNGASLRDLQDSLGHADPRTTRRYDRSRNSLEKSAGYNVARALA